MNMPQDPILLMSITNTLLRDEFSSLDELCKARDWDAEVVRNKLEGAGFIYQPAQNQFR